MDRLEREHMDGLGDGLGMALGIMRKARNLDEATDRVRAELDRAREAKYRDTTRRIREAVTDTGGS